MKLTTDLLLATAACTLGLDTRVNEFVAAAEHIVNVLFHGYF